MSGKHEKPFVPTCLCDPPCHLKEIAAMTRNQLMDALVEAEDELAMANAYIDELLREKTDA